MIKNLNNFSFGKETQKPKPSPFLSFPSIDNNTFSLTEKRPDLGRRSLVLQPKGSLKTQSQNAFVAITKKPTKFCTLCNRSFSKINEHNRRKHPEKLSGPDKLNLVGKKIEMVQGEVYSMSNWVNSIDPSTLNFSQKNNFEKYVTCLNKLSKSFE